MNSGFPALLLVVACFVLSGQTCSAAGAALGGCLLALNSSNNGQTFNARVGQELEITLASMQNAAPPQLSIAALRFEGIAMDGYPNPAGGRVYVYMFAAAANGKEQVEIPIYEGIGHMTGQHTFAVTINVNSTENESSAALRKCGEASLIPDQVNSTPWQNGWTNLIKALRQTFTPSQPVVTAVEVELAQAHASPSEANLGMALLDKDDHVLASVSKTVPLADCGHVLFLMPHGGVRVSPGTAYTISLGLNADVGWKYVIGGYSKGVALTGGFPGRPLSPGFRTTFLFRTFGAQHQSSQ